MTPSAHFRKTLRNQSRLIYFSAAFTVALLDQATKIVVQREVPLHSYIPIVPGFFSIEANVYKEWNRNGFCTDTFGNPQTYANFNAVPEFEDCVALAAAKSLSIKEVQALAVSAYRASQS